MELFQNLAAAFWAESALIVNSQSCQPKQGVGQIQTRWTVAWPPLANTGRGSRLLWTGQNMQDSTGFVQITQSDFRLQIAFCLWPVKSLRPHALPCWVIRKGNILREM